MNDLFQEDLVTDCHDNDIAHHVGIQSAEQCAKLCLQNDMCVGFVMIHRNPLECYVKSVCLSSSGNSLCTKYTIKTGKLAVINKHMSCNNQC